MYCMYVLIFKIHLFKKSLWINWSTTDPNYTKQECSYYTAKL